MTQDRQSRRWARTALAAGGVLVVAVVTAVLFASGIVGRPTAAEPSPSPSSSPRASGAPSTPPPSSSGSPQPSDEPAGLAYEPPTGVLPPGARVIVNDPTELRVAADPEADVAAGIEPGREMRIQGPLIVDGERWYTLTSTDQDDPAFGYVALDPNDDQVSLAPITCPSGEPDIASLAPLGAWERLACNGDREIVLEGHEVVGFGGFRPGVYSPDWLNGFLGAFAIADPDDQSHYLFVRVAPDGPDVSRPQAGGVVGSARLRVTGHFNDEASTSCSVTDLPIGPAVTDRTADLEPIAAEIGCREEFVVTAFEVLDQGGGETPTLAALEVGAVVAPVIDGVSLRKSPGTAAERIGTVPVGSRNVVVDGPIEADGFRWYAIAASGLPPASGCYGPLEPMSCPVWYGWAAAGDPDDGSAWFVPVDMECPDPSTQTLEFLMLEHRLPLACYGSDEITFTAWYPVLDYALDPRAGDGCDPDPSIGWLYCPTADHPEVWSGEEYTGPAEMLYLDPASGASMPARGQWLQITGSYDHPDAAACADANRLVRMFADDDHAVLECRIRLAVSSVEATSSP